MVLVYIENTYFCSKIITYLTKNNIPCTTDPNALYDYILIGQINSKTLSLIENKKVIFITHLEEAKIYYHYNHNNVISKNYMKTFYDLIGKCSLVIVSLPYFKNILKNYQYIKVINWQLPIIQNSGILKKMGLNKYRKKIVFVDFEYENINDLLLISNKYPKMEFILIGYKPKFYLNKRTRNLLNKLPYNVKKIVYLDFDLYLDIIRNSSFCIYSTTNISYINFLNSIFYLKINTIIKDCPYYNDYLIDGKNCYLYDKDLLIKVKRIMEGRVKNMSLETFELVKNNNFKEILKKYKNILK